MGIIKNIIFYSGILLILLGIISRPKKIEQKKKIIQPIEQNISEEPTKMVSDIFDYSDPWLNRFSVDKMPKGSEQD